MPHQGKVSSKNLVNPNRKSTENPWDLQRFGCFNKMPWHYEPSNAISLTCYMPTPPTWFHTTHHREFSASLVTCSGTFFGRSGGKAWFRPYKVHRFLMIWVIPTPTSRCLIPFSWEEKTCIWWVYPVPLSGGKSRRMREPQFTGIVGLHTKVVDMFPLINQNVSVSIFIF